MRLSYDWLIGGPPGDGHYQPIFRSGEIWYGGPYGPQTDPGLEFGTLLPNPSGIPGPCFFLGSGGGSFTASISGTTMHVTALPPGNLLNLGALITGPGVAAGTGITGVPPGVAGPAGTGDYTVNVAQTVPSAQLAAHILVNIITDAPFDNFTPGNDITCSAGESDGAQKGGDWSSYGGGSLNGFGGTNLLQGGTSVNSRGGPGICKGGGSTTGIPGDGFLEGGDTGAQGANVHLIATYLNGITGVIRHRVNSAILWDEIPLGDPTSQPSLPFRWYFYNGGGYGTLGQGPISQGPSGGVKWSAPLTPPVAVSALPAAAGNAGLRGMVNNATVTTFASVVVGGGTNIVPVYCDGTAWRIG